MNVKEAAAYACVSVSVLRGWLLAGLPHYRLGLKRGKIAIQKEDLDGWLANFRVQKKEPAPVKAPARLPSVFKHLRLKTS